MARFDDRADQPRNADAVRAAVDRPLDAVRTGHESLHRLRIFRAEIEHLPDFDAARVHAIARRDFALETRRVVHVFGRGVEIGPLRDQRREIAVVVDVIARHRQIEHAPIAIDAPTRRSRRAR